MSTGNSDDDGSYSTDPNSALLQQLLQKIEDLSVAVVRSNENVKDMREKVGMIEQGFQRIEATSASEAPSIVKPKIEEDNVDTNDSDVVG